MAADRRDLICIGASAGGVEALTRIAAALPDDLPAAVTIVLHLAPDQHSAMPRILTAAGPLQAVHPQDGEPLLPGRIYVAPPDHHMIVEPGKLRLVRSAPENSNRPAIDPLFRTAAFNYGPRVIGVILTGALDDGTAGLLEIEHCGGATVVQDPEDAFCPDMPRSALEYVNPDYVAKLDEIAPLLEKLAGAEVEKSKPVQERDVGHGFNAGTPLDQRVAIDGALWAALRALEEQAELAERMGARARRQGNLQTAVRFEARHEEAQAHAGVLRRLLTMEPVPPAA